MSRIFSQTTDGISYATGVGGNLYVWSSDKQKIEEVCKAIGKSAISVYFNKAHKCWTIRIKCKRHKQQFLSTQESK